MENFIEIAPLTPFIEREVFEDTRHVFAKPREIFAQTDTTTITKPT